MKSTRLYSVVSLWMCLFLASCTQKLDEQALDQGAVLTSVDAVAQAYLLAGGKQVQPPEGYQMLTVVTGSLPGQLKRRPYAIVFRSITGNKMLIAFRGATKDFLTVDKSLFSKGTTFVAEDGKKLPGEVQSAAFQIYQSMQNDLFKVMKANTPSSLIITGHSLGAQLALLFLTDISVSMPDLKYPIRAYTFGAPKVGTKPFAEYLGAHTLNRYSIMAFNNLNDKAIHMFPPEKSGYVRIAMQYPLCFKVEQKPSKAGSLESVVGPDHWLKNYIFVLKHKFGEKTLPSKITMCKSEEYDSDGT